MHGELRHTDIQRGHAQITGGQRPDGAATTHVTAYHKCLVRQAKLITDMPVQSGRPAVGGVALVAVDLDHRAGVEFRAVVAVVLVGVVRGYAMGVVGRDQQRALDGADEALACRQDAAQYLFEEGAVGATGRAGEPLLQTVFSSNRILSTFRPSLSSLDLHHANRAFLEVGLFGDRIVGVESDQVD